MEYSIDGVLYGPAAQNICKSFSFFVTKMGCVKEASLCISQYHSQTIITCFSQLFDWSDLQLSEVFAQSCQDLISI